MQTFKEKKEVIYYKDYIIHQAERNSGGIRYYAYSNYGILRADTLTGIKRLLNKK